MKNFPSTDKAVAACVGKVSLFESKRHEDHAQAKALCAVCPAFAACVANLQTVLDAPKHLGGTPEGTWAGKLFGRPERPTERTKCGSEKGYHQHKHYGEQACRPCLDARAKKQREREQIRKAKAAA